jgi:hypothetical protein
VNLLSSAAERLWHGLPRVLRRTPGLAALFRDGDWSLSFSPLALLLPAGAVTLGYRLGGFRSPTEQFFSSSITVMALMLAVATSGAALGFWTTIGFAIGDLLRFRHTHDSALLYPNGLKHFTLVQTPLIISYAVLLLLLTTVPLMATHSRLNLIRLYGPTLKIQLAACILSVSIAAAMAWCWTRSVPMLIRPLWSYADGVGIVPAISPLARHGRVLVVVAAAGTGARSLIEAVLPVRPVPADAIARDDQAERARSLPVVLLGLLLGAGLSTLLLSGLTASWTDAIQLFAVIVAAGLLRRVLLPAVPRYSHLVWRVPMLVRVMCCGLLGWWIGRRVLGPAITDPSNDTMRPVLEATMIGILAICPLLPTRQRALR